MRERRRVSMERLKRVHERQNYRLVVVKADVVRLRTKSAVTTHCKKILN